VGVEILGIIACIVALEWYVRTPSFFAPIAQWSEQSTHNAWVVSSNLTGCPIYFFANVMELVYMKILKIFCFEESMRVQIPSFAPFNFKSTKTLNKKLIMNIKLNKEKTLRFYNLFKWVTLLYLSGAITCFCAIIVTPKSFRHTLVDVGDYLTNQKSNDNEDWPQEQEQQVNNNTYIDVAESILKEDGAPKGVLPPPKQEDEQPTATGVMVPLLEEYDNDDGTFNGDANFGLNNKLSDLQKLQQLPMLFTQREIDALIEVESSGDEYCIGDNGKAKGVLQLWNIYIKDVNRKFGTNYNNDDALGNKALSILIMNAYMNIYAREHTFKEYAFKHNGGPEIFKKDKSSQQWKNAANYWDKVQKAYDG
jgi:hypothetical protein